MDCRAWTRGEESCPPRFGQSTTDLETLSKALGHGYDASSGH